MKRCVCGRLIYDWWVSDEDADELDEVGLGTYALCDECASRLTPVAPDRVDARAGDGAGETRAAGEHDG